MDDPNGASEVTDLTALARAAAAGGDAIQQLQARYDEVGWRIQEPSWAKARHLLYHLMSATTELALLVEEVEHAQERGETVSSEEFNSSLAQHAGISANLLFHAAQIANMSGISFGAELTRLHHRNAQRFAPTSAFAELDLHGQG
ncbi:MAG: hypothetical protein ACRCY9_11420 [Phycicoccus sp.]